MHRRGVDRFLQVGEGRHVADGVVHENVVELAVEPQRAHVALDVLGFRIDGAALREHPSERSVSVSLN